MTTIQINAIEGSRKSASNNDAFSIVAYDHGQPTVLAFVPAAEIEGKSPEQISAVFADAVSSQPPQIIEAVCQKARTLKIRTPEFA